MGTLGYYLDKVKDFENLTQKEQVKLVSYFFSLTKEKESFSTPDISKCFEDNDLKLPANISHCLNKLSEEKPYILVKKGKLYSFQRSAKKDLENIYKIFSDSKDNNEQGDISNQEKSISINNSIGVITASPDEFNAIRSLLHDVVDYKSNDNDSILYYKGFLEGGGKKIEIIIPYPLDMGIPSAVISTTKVILKFKPKYLFMIGIAAGNRKINNIGDILIAEKSLNYNEVVEIEKKDNETSKKFMQAPDSINRNFKSLLSQFSDSDFIKLIQSEYPFKDRIDKSLKCSKGLLVTGSSLVRSQSKIEEINEIYPNVVGLDMETHGFYYASAHCQKESEHHFVSMKSVSDFGDNTGHKLSSEERKNYALYTSSLAFKYFVLNYLNFKS